MTAKDAPYCDWPGGGWLVVEVFHSYVSQFMELSIRRPESRVLTKNLNCSHSVAGAQGLEPGIVVLSFLL